MLLLESLICMPSHLGKVSSSKVSGTYFFSVTYFFSLSLVSIFCTSRLIIFMLFWSIMVI
jgi:hypothetical protein